MNVPGGNSVVLEIRNHELELVEQRLAENEVLRPYIMLVMREKVLETEMLGDSRFLILRRYFDETFRILLCFGTEPPPFFGPESNAVAAD